MKPCVAVIALLLSLVLIGCGNHAEQDAKTHAAADRMQREAAAAALERNYEQARAAGLWEQAIAYADQLQRTAPGTAAARAVQATLSDTSQHAVRAQDQQRMAAQWSYSSRLPDAGTPGVMVSASVRSRDSSSGSARLVLLRHPTAGRSLYLILDNGQFKCVPVCKIQVRFDQEPSHSFAAKSSESNRKTLFIDDEQSIRDRLDSVRVVTFTTIVDGHPRELLFEVGGFDRVQFERQMR
jgi:hypothetical protein